MAENKTDTDTLLSVPLYAEAEANAVRTYLDLGQQLTINQMILSGLRQQETDGKGVRRRQRNVLKYINSLSHDEKLLYYQQEHTKWQQDLKQSICDMEAKLEKIKTARQATVEILATYNLYNDQDSADRLDVIDRIQSEIRNLSMRQGLSFINETARTNDLEKSSLEIQRLMATPGVSTVVIVPASTSSISSSSSSLSL
jgi:hypothetical protein